MSMLCRPLPHLEDTDVVAELPSVAMRTGAGPDFLHLDASGPMTKHAPCSTMPSLVLRPAVMCHSYLAWNKVRIFLSLSQHPAAPEASKETSFGESFKKNWMHI